MKNNDFDPAIDLMPYDFIQREDKPKSKKRIFKPSKKRNATEDETQKPRIIKRKNQINSPKTIDNKNENNLKQKSQETNDNKKVRHLESVFAIFNSIERQLRRKLRVELKDENFRLEDISQPIDFKAKRNAVRKTLKDLEKATLWYKGIYKKYLISDKSIFFYKKWIWNNKGISENLNIKRNNKLLPLLDYLCNHRLDWRESESLAHEIGAGKLFMKTKKEYEVERFYVLVKPHLEDIEDKLDMSRSLIRKYLKGMSESGIIKAMKKVGPRGQKAYALGYYQPYKDKDDITKYKPIWFLKGNKEMKQALKDFYRPE